MAGVPPICWRQFDLPRKVVEGAHNHAYLDEAAELIYCFLPGGISAYQLPWLPRDGQGPGCHTEDLIKSALNVTIEGAY
jgi:hypothetical protein